MENIRKLEDQLLKLIEERRKNRRCNFTIYHKLLVQLDQQLIRLRYRQRGELRSPEEYFIRKCFGEDLAIEIFKDAGYEITRKEKTFTIGPDFLVADKENNTTELIHVMPLIQNIQKRKGLVIINKGSLQSLKNWPELILIIETTYKDKLYATRIKELKDLEGIYNLEETFKKINNFFPKIKIEKIKEIYKQIDFSGLPTPQESKPQHKQTKNQSNYFERIKEIKIKYPLAYTPWLRLQEEKLKELFSKGKTIDEISKELQRQPGGIKARLKKLNLIQEPF